MSLLTISIYTALTAAFIILVLNKTGIRDYLIEHSPKPLSKLFSCDFCLGFWISVILALILAVFFQSLILLYIPILGAPIIRILV